MYAKVGTRDRNDDEEIMMAQATPTKRAPDDVLLAGTIPQEAFAQFLQEYHIPSEETSLTHPPLALIESLPQQVVAPERRPGLLQFTLFDPAFDFTPYTTGRIFHTLGELRWERKYKDIQIVYTGHHAYKPDLANAQVFALDVFLPRERAYFLFGKRLDEKQREMLGPLTQPGDFAEVRIPRLLRYPALPGITDAERVQLLVCEYEDLDTALNVAYRFKSLVRFQKQAEKSGEGQNA
jgi:hypothetical protein